MDNKKEIIHHIAAKVKMRRSFVCSKCNSRRVGETERYEIDVCNTQQLKDAIDAKYCKSTYMPVGWSYNGEFTCEKCKGDQ